MPLHRQPALDAHAWCRPLQDGKDALSVLALPGQVRPHLPRISYLQGAQTEPPPTGHRPIPALCPSPSLSQRDCAQDAQGRPRAGGGASGGQSRGSGGALGGPRALAQRRGAPLGGPRRRHPLWGRQPRALLEPPGPRGGGPEPGGGSGRPRTARAVPGSPSRRPRPWPRGEPLPQGGPPAPRH